jgi:hypothetical protein
MAGRSRQRVFNLIRVKAGKLVPDVERTIRWP